MADERRRTTLGPATSAAIPVLWALLAECGGKQAKLAVHLDEDSGNVSRLLYGDRKAGRALSLKLREFGVSVDSWEEPLPEGWTLPHVANADESGEHGKATDEDIKHAAGG